MIRPLTEERFFRDNNSTMFYTKRAMEASIGLSLCLQIEAGLILIVPSTKIEFVR
jgi:hypothetical protein